MTQALRPWGSGAAAFVAALVWADPLSASCDPPHGRWIALEVAGELDAAFVRAVSADVLAGLGDEVSDVCPVSAAGRQPPLALIEIERRGPDEVNLSLVLRDGNSASHVSRGVKLAGIPHDSRAFAIALAARELLGADWLGPRGVPEPPPKPLPPEPTTALGADVAPTTERTAPRAWRLATGVAAEFFVAGQAQWGVDLGALIPIAKRLSFGLRGGARQGLDVEASHGRVSSRALSVSGEARYLAWRAPVEVGIGLGMQGQWIELRGVAPDPGASASAWAGLALYARGSGFATFHLGGPLWLDTAAALGVPLRGLDATDAGEPASGASGLQLSSTIAVSIEL